MRLTRRVLQGPLLSGLWCNCAVFKTAKWGGGTLFKFAKWGGGGGALSNFGSLPNEEVGDFLILPNEEVAHFLILPRAPEIWKICDTQNSIECLLSVQEVSMGVKTVLLSVLQNSIKCT